MTGKTDTNTTRRGADRRSGVDRRKLDKGPPGKVERRRNVESRKPDVSEVEMTNSEWGDLQRPFLPTE